uniref:Cytochrome C biogenesis protein CcdA n=1 Tax=uncultured marine virus TaxID=186617 RepID=A0A0F7LAX4_9VIRU|nr:cytochrome C biogenesis protein CcdA [uncultured marine virus]
MLLYTFYKPRVIVKDSYFINIANGLKKIFAVFLGIYRTFKPFVLLDSLITVYSNHQIVSLILREP